MEPPRPAMWAAGSPSSTRLGTDAGDDAIAMQVRAHQDLIERWPALDRQNLALLGTAPAGDPALTEAALEQAVRDLRAILDPTWPARAAAPLLGGLAQPSEAPFAADAAYRLYLDWIAPLAGVLAGSETLIVVKEGALSGPPLAGLLREAADLDGANTTALAAAPLAQLFTRAGADAAGVRGLARLPGTRRELTGLARALGVPPGEMRFGAEATETAVTTSDSLRRARIAVFATHGLLAGDLTGLPRPCQPCRPETPFFWP